MLSAVMHCACLLNKYLLFFCMCVSGIVRKQENKITCPQVIYSVGWVQTHVRAERAELWQGYGRGHPKSSHGMLPVPVDRLWKL